MCVRMQETESAFVGLFNVDLYNDIVTARPVVQQRSTQQTFRICKDDEEAF